MKKFESWLDKGTEKILGKPEYANKKFKIMNNALPQKMSEVLLDFAAPLLDAIDKSDKVVLESTIKMATFMWNYAVISSGQYPKILTKSLVNQVKTTVENQIGNDPIFRTFLAILMERKKSLYPDNNRMIVDFNVNWDRNGDTFHLTVLSPGYYLTVKD